jgi:lysophospholipase L1-like esterase
MVCAFVMASAGVLRADTPGEFFFHDGDRIVFLGDSITEQYQYSTDIESYLTTRFPKWRLTFLNAGISGDTATGGARRFERQVLAEKPTAVTIDFGMNDGGYGAFRPAAAANFIKKTEEMLEAARKARARVALISPNCVDWRPVRRGRPGVFKTYRETQKQFYAPLKELAAKFQIPFVDQYAITRNDLEKMESQHAETVQPFEDGVHTTAPVGGLLMAHTILTGLKAPALVSDATIEVTGEAKATEAKGCTIANLKATAGRIAFDRSDEALPLPVEKNWLPLFPYVNDLKDLNWYGLKIAGLATGKYALAIDNKDLGVTYTAQDLAAGVNLGNLTAGPIHDQAKRVFDEINKKNALVHKRFREVVMKSVPADQQAKQADELARRMKVIDEKQAEIYKLVQPTTHVFELTLVNGEAKQPSKP